MHQRISRAWQALERQHRRLLFIDEDLHATPDLEVRLGLSQDGNLTAVTPEPTP